LKETKWISVDEQLPELTEQVKMGHVLDEYNEGNLENFGKFVVDCEFLQSREVMVAEKKGDDFEEDVGILTDTGWATNCDNVTHWKDKAINIERNEDG